MLSTVLGLYAAPDNEMGSFVMPLETATQTRISGMSVFFMSCLVKMPVNRSTRHGCFVASSDADVSDRRGVIGTQVLGALTNVTDRWYARGDDVTSGSFSSPGTPSGTASFTLLVIKIASVGPSQATIAVKAFGGNDVRTEAAFDATAVVVTTNATLGNFSMVNMFGAQAYAGELVEYRLGDTFAGGTESFAAAVFVSDAPCSCSQMWRCEWPAEHRFPHHYW